MNRPMPPTPAESPLAPAPASRRFISLRMKFVAFFSLILVVTISALSWYFVETRRQAMNDNLKELGAILLTNTVHNAHFWLGGLVPENHEVLREFANSLMAIDHVVYVIITASDGRILEQQSKWTRPSSNGSTDTPEQRIYPDEQIAKALLGTPVESFQMTPLVISSDHTLVRPRPASELLLPFFVWHEAILDFAIPVLRPQDTSSPLPHFSR